jgi:microcystin-dependent protein
MKTRRAMLSGISWFVGVALARLTAFAKSTQSNSERGVQDSSIEELKTSFSSLRKDYTTLSETVSDLSLKIPAIGTILAFAGLIDSSHPAPPNFMMCDGTAMKKVSESDPLWKAIGTTWGDGSKQRDVLVTGYDFNLPDLRGYFLRGVDGGAHRDQEAGRRVGTSQDDGLHQHSHTVTIAKTDYFKQPDNFSQPTGGLRDNDTFGKGVSTFPTSQDPAENGFETRPKNVAVYWLIRVS